MQNSVPTAIMKVSVTLKVCSCSGGNRKMSDMSKKEEEGAPGNNQVDTSLQHFGSFV